MSSVSPVRPATRADVGAAVRTLGRAFADYPWTRHTIAADGHQRRLEAFQELFVARIGLEHGRGWVTDDCAAVSVWTTPDSTEVGSVFAELAPRFAELAGDRAPFAEEAERVVSPYRPQEPVWFLGTVGVDPERQGNGLGSAVIRPGLAEADRVGAAAFLETSLEGNVRFYQRLGFVVTADVRLPSGGPRTWFMTRPPH
ncbi:Acetyltransferase (GNAT) family protein [Actinopolyspora xinjiangensis]|uniref:Acetyltransferase (GNAT) family protein n=1 Tax=Actinopolyspora xinjiangensis TaxID=405564 RepID=A0A1H0RH46_9ACTN|nr:Acetyltransferase (GNAT) family protein [Actinopolyspora xinjiangensis]